MNGREVEEAPSTLPAELPSPPEMVPSQTQPLIEGKAQPIPEEQSTEEERSSRSSFPEHQPENRIYFGLFTYRSMDEIQERIGKKPSILQFGIAWGEKANGFPLEDMENTRRSGAIPEITWSPSGFSTDPNVEAWNYPEFQLKKIIQGDFDNYIRQFAGDAQKWGHPFFLRFAHEMNGNWYPWSETVNGNSRGEYVQMWKHVYNVFEEECPKCATWVWAPDAGGQSYELPQDFTALYPGDDYVDWVGLSSYNVEVARSNEAKWEEFETVVQPAYEKLQTISSNKSVFISETGVVETGGNKAQWIRNVLPALKTKFPKIKAYSYFDIYREDFPDTRIDTSPESTAAFRDMVLDSYFATNEFRDLNASPIPPPKGSSPRGLPSPSQEATSPAVSSSRKLAEAVSVEIGTRELGVVRTGGGTTMTGRDAVASATGVDKYVTILKAIPWTHNRIHFVGETADAEEQTERHFPQPDSPPAPWNFSYLDDIVDLARQVRDGGGPDFTLVCHNAPTWMATRHLQGMQPADCAQWAQYCARWVRYYNLGGFVDDTGHYVKNPAGTTNRVNYWTTWDEPDINDFGDTWTEAPSFQPVDWAKCYATTSQAMRSVDPTIKIGGPSTVTRHQAFLDALAALDPTKARVDFLSFHYYPVDVEHTDAQGFKRAALILPDEDREASATIPAALVGLPIFVDEMNSDGNGRDSRVLATSTYELAWMPLTYIAHITAMVDVVIHYETAGYETDGPAYDLFDVFSGRPSRKYWVHRYFWSAVRLGSTRLECISQSADISCLALRDNGKIRVVLVNHAVADPQVKNGVGVLRDIVLQLPIGNYDVAVVSRNTDPVSGPEVRTVAGGTQISLTIDGYGSGFIIQK